MFELNSRIWEARAGSKVMRKSKSWKKLHVVFANSTTPISILKIGSNFLLVALKSLRTFLGHLNYSCYSLYLGLSSPSKSADAKEYILRVGFLEMEYQKSPSHFLSCLLMDKAHFSIIMKVDIRKKK